MGAGQGLLLGIRVLSRQSHSFDHRKAGSWRERPDADAVRAARAKKGGCPMMSTILLVFAFVLACLAAYNIGPPRWSLGWAALACYFASLLLGSFGIVSRR